MHECKGFWDKNNTARKYPSDCKMARIGIDRRLTRVICDWRDKQ